MIYQTQRDMIKKHPCQVAKNKNDDKERFTDDIKVLNEKTECPY